jgi:hypothetical protein
MQEQEKIYISCRNPFFDRENSARTVVRLASFIIFCKTELSGKRFPYSREGTLL